MDNDSRRKLFANITSFLSSASVGVIAVQIAVTWTLICGVTGSSLATLFVLLGLSAVTSSRLNLVLNARWQLALAGLMGLASWWFASVTDALLTVNVSFISGAGWLTFLLPAAFAGLCCFCLFTWHHVHKSNADQLQSTEIPGLAAGLLLMLLHGISPFPMGITVIVLVAATCMSQLVSRPVPKVAIHDSAADRPVRWSTMVAAVGAFGAGVLGQGMLRIASSQFFLSTTLLVIGSAVALLIFLVLRSRIGRRVLTARIAAPVILLIIAAIPFAAQEAVDLNLHLNAVTQSAALVTLSRSLQISLLLVVSGSAAFVFVNETPASNQNIDPRFHAGFLLLGLGAALAFSSADARVIILTGLVISVSPLLLPRDAALADNTARRRTALGGTLAALCLAVATVTAALPSSTSNSLLLFSSHAEAGYRMGHRKELIAQSHSMRLLDNFESDGGSVGIWRTSGDQIEFRRDGVSTGAATTNAFTSPQPVTDSLICILPLVLHRNANSILILGDDGGAGLRAASGFPVHTIDAVRSDSRITKVVQSTVWQKMDPPPAKDERITIRHDAAAPAVRRVFGKSSWDVVVADTGRWPITDGQCSLTAEFYSAVKRQLAPDGVFCQRLSMQQVGPAPLWRAVSTVSGLFGRVAVIRMSPGEIALVCGPESLLDGELLNRLQKPHVARELARSGWDWSQVAALPVVDTADPVGIFNHVAKLPSSNAANAYFAFALPHETVRRGQKAEELRQIFAPHQQRLADAIPASPAYQEFARRYTSVIQQAEILTAFPDQPWPYRKSLRMEMQRSPRPPIERVRNGKIVRAVHPLDEQRKGYFVTLGAVLKQAQAGFVDPLKLRELAAFTNIHEPLLSHFAHHELVRIHEATSHPGPAMELRHRLHTVYFTEPKDLSVRRVTDAMNQILEDPELLPSNAARFDHINSMLQELVRRWEARRGSSTASARHTQRDVDLCIQVASRALESLEKWGQGLNVTSEDIRLRRRFVNMKLVAPLRSYREQVLAHRLRTETPERIGDLSDDELPILLDEGSLTTN